MAVEVLALHHHGARVGETAAHADRALGFYRDVLGLPVDQGRPHVPDIPGYWVDVGGRAQIHLISAKGLSRRSDGERIDPAGPHVALAVPDIQEAKVELERIELHQAGICRCDRADGTQAPGARA